jgi:hypothetical protein
MNGEQDGRLHISDHRSRWQEHVPQGPTKEMLFQFPQRGRSAVWLDGTNTCIYTHSMRAVGIDHPAPRHPNFVLTPHA